MKGLATYRAFRWTDEALAKNSKLLDHSTNPAFQLGMIQRWLGSTLKFLMAFIATAIVALATQLRSSSSFTGASMVSLITFSAFLAALISNYTLLETSLGAVNRLREFGSKTETEDLPGEDTIPDVSWPEKGAIEIRAVSTSYEYVESEAMYDIILTLIATLPRRRALFWRRAEKTLFSSCVISILPSRLAKKLPSAVAPAGK